MSDKISMAARPRALNDMLKQAMSSAMSRNKIAEEARRQLDNLGEPEEKTANAQPELEAVVPTEYVEKLAEASDYVLELLKQGAGLPESIVAPGKGPNALEVTQTEGEGPALEPNAGQAGTNQVPMDPPTEKFNPFDGGKTQMKTDMDHAPGAGDPPVSGSTKNAAALIRQLHEQEKQAAGPAAFLRMVKKAEDAINPANISSPSVNPAAPPEGVSETGTSGPPAEGKGRVPETADGVAGYTRRDAKAPEKKDMGPLLDEPMMSSSGDSVLDDTLKHTDEAGAKVAAARALLSNIAGGR